MHPGNSNTLTGRILWPQAKKKALEIHVWKVQDGNAKA